MLKVVSAGYKCQEFNSVSISIVSAPSEKYLEHFSSSKGYLHPASFSFHLVLHFKKEQLVIRLEVAEVATQQGEAKKETEVEVVGTRQKFDLRSSHLFMHSDRFTNYAIHLYEHYKVTRVKNVPISLHRKGVKQFTTR